MLCLIGQWTPSHSLLVAEFKGGGGAIYVCIRTGFDSLCL